MFMQIFGRNVNFNAIIFLLLVDHSIIKWYNTVVRITICVLFTGGTITLKFAVVDDDRIFSQQLIQRIQNVCAEHSIQSSVDYFDNPDIILSDDVFTKYQVIFMDIEMPGINGIEAVKEINRLRTSDTTPYIIFVTAQDNMVFEALREFPYSFVRKSHIGDIDECILHISRKVSCDCTYSVKMGRSVKVLEVNRIVYVDKQGNYVTFHTSDGDFQERSSIDKKYGDLSAYGFIRPHIGCIVNAAHIVEYNSSCLVMSDGVKIPISRSHKKECKERFNDWMVKNR